MVILALLLMAQFPGQERAPVTIEARAGNAEAKVGELFEVTVGMEIPVGWYIYPAGKSEAGKPTSFTFEGADVAGPVRQPAPKFKPAKDPLPAYEYHEGRVAFVIPLRLRGTFAPGPIEVKGKAVYQICSDVCIDRKKDFSFVITLLPGGAEVAAPTAADLEFAQRGFLGLLLLGMLGGLVSLIMPCTYPLIPITLTYFVKQAAGSRAHGLALSSVYAAGIIVTFTGLGFLMTLLLGSGGATIFAANPWVNVVVGLLFLWFTGSLFGWYEIQLPFGLGASLAGGRRKGMGGAFILGLLFAIVTFTCTIPIAATILSVAAGQHKFAALLAMLFYSITMALPFFLMGLFPGLIREVPKSGGWLTTVKISMGFVELGLALFYFSKADQVTETNILTRHVMLAIWVGVSLAVALYLLRFFRARPTAMRLGGAALFLAFGGVMAYGFTGNPLGRLEIIVPPEAIHGTTLPAGLAEAKRQGKPLFAEFTGLT